MGRQAVVLACIFAALANTVAHCEYASTAYWDDPWPTSDEAWPEVVAQIKTTSDRLYEYVLAFRRLTTAFSMRYSAYQKVKHLQPEALKLPHMWQVRKEIWHAVDELINAEDQLRLLIRRQKYLLSIIKGLRVSGDGQHWSDTNSICRKAGGEVREAEALLEQGKGKYNNIQLE
ncbi:UNVERIFIED_CONTAM: hypothetical protein HHA_215980 [Hammondia hammondi]|eukprot:XP_008886339.1 hypothetical protein HHA_215980 [Hammondia hammondi]